MFCSGLIFCCSSHSQDSNRSRVWCPGGLQGRRGSVLSGMDSERFWWEQDNRQDKYLCVGREVMRDQDLTLPGSQRVVVHGHSDLY